MSWYQISTLNLPVHKFVYRNPYHEGKNLKCYSLQCGGRRASSFVSTVCVCFLFQHNNVLLHKASFIIKCFPQFVVVELTNAHRATTSLTDAVVPE